MSIGRNARDYADNASRYHIAVGSLLQTSKEFSGYRITQEYPVHKVNPSYRNKSHSFDWVILDLRVVIEVHGSQHYHAATFGGRSNEQALDSFQEQKQRDRHKADAAVEAGYTYLEIPYKEVDKLTSERLMNLILEHMSDEPVVQDEEPDESEYHKQLLAKAREYRRKQYRRAKQWLDAKKE